MLNQQRQSSLYQQACAQANAAAYFAQQHNSLEIYEPPFDPWATFFKVSDKALNELSSFDPKCELPVEEAMRFLWRRREL